MIARQRTFNGFSSDGIMVLLLSAVLLVFGFVMIYSASSISAMTQTTTDNNPYYYLLHQGIAAAIGLVAATVVVWFDYHVWTRYFNVLFSLVSLVFLILVFTSVAGQDAYGATRWIRVGPMTIQPSEFAKVTMLLSLADCVERWFDNRRNFDSFTKCEALGGILLPLLLILLQPDKGTVIICACTILFTLFMLGLPWRYVIGLVGLGVVGIVVLSLKDDYSRSRVLTMLDPWRDEYGAGYQLIQGFYAFGAGGLFGVGIGYGHEKYLYLPMAHNDFIFAVIGEECGIVGAVIVVVLFIGLVIFGLRIASDSQDAAGKVLAFGASIMLCIQMLVNALGVLGVIPLSGKPIPFLSYGGTSVMASCLLVALVLSVDKETYSC